MLAVVNIVLRDPSAVGAVDAALESGSHGRSAAAVRGGGESGGGLGVAWSVNGADTDGETLRFPAPGGDGSVAVAGADRDSGWGAHGTVRYGELAITALGGQREKGIPTGAWDTVAGDLDARTTDRFRLLGLRWHHPLGVGLSLAARAQVGHYSYDGVYPGVDFESRDSTDNNWLGTDVQLRWEASSNHQLVVGAEHRDNRRADYRSFDADGTLYYAGDHPFRVSSFYVEDELQIGENLVITSGVRYDHDEQSGDSTSPRLALVWMPRPATTVKLLYGRAFRSPNLYELWYQEGSVDSAKSNPDLVPEKVDTVELAATHRLREGVFAGASVYASRFHGLIEQRVDPADDRLQFQNAAEARTLGGELELTAQTRNGMAAYASLGLQRTVEEATRERLTNSPARLLKAGLAGPLAERWRFGAEVSHESSRRTVYGTATPGVTLANALLAWQATARLTLELQVRNLLDREYGLPGGIEHSQPAIDQDGRTFTLRLEARL
jgi:iron complex outermembrane receptor protein